MQLIDARKAMSGPHGRPLTMTLAVGLELDRIPVGEDRIFTGAIDGLGDDVPFARVRMLINKLKGDRCFTTRTLKDGGLRVWRIS